MATTIESKLLLYSAYFWDHFSQQCYSLALLLWITSGAKRVIWQSQIFDLDYL
jgi:hypothetical protein